MIGASTNTLWIIKGKGVMARSVSSTTGQPDVTLQLLGTSRLNGAAL